MNLVAVLCGAGNVSSALTSPFSLRINVLNSLPSRHRKSSPGSRMPHLVAIARAVLMLSPVTMRTVIPARWHLVMASGTWRRERDGSRDTLGHMDVDFIEDACKCYCIAWHHTVPLSLR